MDDIIFFLSSRVNTFFFSKHVTRLKRIYLDGEKNQEKQERQRPQEKRDGEKCEKGKGSIALVLN